MENKVCTRKLKVNLYNNVMLYTQATVSHIMNQKKKTQRFYKFQNILLSFLRFYSFMCIDMNHPYTEIPSKSMPICKHSKSH